jgi:DNA repair protein
MPKDYLKYCDYDFSKTVHNGGFLISEEITKHRNDSSCSFCKSININHAFTAFDLNYCHDCIKEKNIKLITFTESIQNYLLVKSEFDDLKYIEKVNKHSKYSKMKLYLEHQIIEKAINKFGSLKGLEDAKLEKKLQREKRVETKFKKTMKELRKNTKFILKQDHKHQFIDEDGKRKCNCGFIIQYEEINI